MRAFKKLNRGMLLTFIVLIILIVYLVALELSRAVQKEEIRDICTEVLEVMSEKIILPENARLFSAEYDVENYNAWVRDIQEQMKKYQAENTTLPACIATAFRTQAEANVYLTSYKNTSAADFECVFTGDMATVTFSTWLTYETENGLLETTPATDRERVVHRFILQKEQGSWKIVVFDVVVPTYNLGVEYY